MDLLRLISLERAGSGRLEAALMVRAALVPKGLVRSRGRGHLGWKMDALSISHNPSVLIVDRGYPIFPKERGTQNHVVSLNIRDIKVNVSINWSEFYRYPGPVIDF